MKILFHVQHLLGIGHVRRTALIARALGEAGAEVTVVQGGFPVAGTDFGRARVVQLPPARAADASFRPILDETGRPIDDAWRDRRRAMLLALHDEIRPDALILETFPFGRRAFRFELVPLLESAAVRDPRPLIASSVRDILVAKDAAKQREMAEWAERWFDLVLVHGDAGMIPFGATFPHADRLKGRLRHTGYVAPPQSAAAPP
ncbi:MAG TPA: glycosyl transferase, partial [Alphaproteobacteria bacterium]|nr:glycosyl transferase [Alphaproteobacteria bacterium]